MSNSLRGSRSKSITVFESLVPPPPRNADMSSVAGASWQTRYASAPLPPPPTATQLEFLSVFEKAAESLISLAVQPFTPTSTPSPPELSEVGGAGDSSSVRRRPPAAAIAPLMTDWGMVPLMFAQKLRRASLATSRELESE